MACDRFIYWGETRPTPKQIQQVLEDYVGTVGKVENTTRGLFCTFQGIPASALRRVAPELGFSHEEGSEMFVQTCWFEVCVGANSIDIITRSQNEFTNAAAEGIAALSARVWNGRREE